MKTAELESPVLVAQPVTDSSLCPRSSPTMVSPPREHARLADNLCNLRRCPTWGLPDELRIQVDPAVAILDAIDLHPLPYPCGWSLLRQSYPRLHQELAAYEACSALQRMEGVSEKEPWTRDRCFQALDAFRALAAQRRRVSRSSYSSNPMQYAPPHSVTPLQVGMARNPLS